ncbi:MAG: DUF1800 domain-containing protein [Acidobacteria bacterium]|nr:DUF1800 domain-containing protein [Acidobacteriota bacterium]
MWARLGCAVVLVAATTGTGVAQRRTDAVPSSPDDKMVVHVLNRLGFGPGPGDVDRVRRLGLAAYIEQQLQPSRIADDAMTARLAAFETLTMSTRDLAAKYYLPAQMQRREVQRAEAAAAAKPDMRSEISAPPAADRPENKGMQGERLVLAELAQQKILRAAYSERQLDEVLVDFWFNHFNVFAGKGQTRIYVTEYERDTIRPHVLGKFRDLLGAVAESPAMLFYLDNWQSAVPGDAATSMNMRRRRAGVRQQAMQPAPAPTRRRGINENYARELMELHTLGVDGGYAQKDVQEIARAFTGWTIDVPRQGGGFRFESRMHDSGEKTVLGKTIRAGGGKKDGEQVLDLLATHPSTARFIATKLARRFVADDPPAALVDRAAARFKETDGDIREVVRVIITSPEFFAASSYRAKVKTPLEFVASAVRAAGVDVRNGLLLAQSMRQLGMPLYMCQPPTGYSDKAEAWVNTGALLNRMNFAVTLSSHPRRAGSTATVVTEDQIASVVLAGDVSQTTRATVARATTEQQKIALLLGSPDFQKR